MNTLTASYSPDDNKIRLRSVSRLDRELYDRVRAAGFSWAPKQDLFVAPMWTPEREDLMLELCGEIGDEDTSLVERAEQRADRFEDYSDKREVEAERAREAVDRIAGGIPLGQPILVGHHSERHARRDARRIEDGMRKAVKLWDTSQYWTRRASGALRHARYLERPDVRARRIKKIEADDRRIERRRASLITELKAWRADDLTTERARRLASLRFSTRFAFDGQAKPVSLGDALDRQLCTVEKARGLIAPQIDREIDSCERWARHYQNRLAYERAMLADSGYVEPLKPKSLKSTLPLLNYRQDQVTIPNMYHAGQFMVLRQVEMTKAEYAHKAPDFKGTRIADLSHKIRIAMVSGSELVAVFLKDSKVHEKPPATPLVEPQPRAPRMPREPRPTPARTAFDDMKDSLKSGVQVVSAPQLFRTPSTVAADMVALAEIHPDHRVLEPSAGTGALLSAMNDAVDGVQPVAVEINYDLATRLRLRHARVIQGDFLELLAADLGGKFDRILMNPPFGNGADIAHILHALELTKPGGRAVAICANGPRQQALLKPRASKWEELPDDTFASEHTHVRTALAVFDVE